LEQTMSMYRIVGRDLLRCHVGGGHELVKRDLGNGHVECRVVPLKTWEFVSELSDEAYAARLQCMEATKEERERANRERACKRAKQRVRHLCKARGYDTMVTLTYAANMTDRELLGRHLQEFHRRMGKLIPGWSYVAAYERQKRGAWHVHMAVHRLPRDLPSRSGVIVKSWNVIRAVWRSITGELGGNVDVQARKRNSRRAPSKIAAYLSKYMTKDFAEGELWSNRFSASKFKTGEGIPPAERIRFVGYDLFEVARVVFDDLPSYVSEQLWWGLGRYKDTLWWILDLNIRPREVGDAH
jgi:hypothetical protein